MPWNIGPQESALKSLPENAHQPANGGMAQQLQVFKDPSIVRNVPVTPLERLQLELDKRAPTYMFTPRTTASSPMIAGGMSPPDDGPSGGGNDPWGAFTGFVNDTPYPVRSMSQIADALKPPVPGPNGSLVAKDETRLTGTPGPILSFNGDENTGTPAERAINVTVNGGAHPGVNPFTLPWVTGAGGMNWEPATVAGPVTTGDAWQGARIGAPGVAPRGMIMGPRPKPKAPVMRSGGNSGPARFLREQGVDTSRMTSGELANAFNKAIF